MDVSDRLRTWWHGWRCHFDHHVWEKAHPGIWNGGYYRCAWCQRRTVKGGDLYGPAAPHWINLGIEPPATIPAIAWGKEGWDRWEESILDERRRRLHEFMRGEVSARKIIYPGGADE